MMNGARPSHPSYFFFQAEDGIRDDLVTGVQTCALPISIGAVWEWTASPFLPYPGFRAFPYREYSEVFFGSEYRVLRGASWAARSSVARASFRNWDHPIRRQVFAGLRCAYDTTPQRGEIAP